MGIPVVRPERFPAAQMIVAMSQVATSGQFTNGGENLKRFESQVELILGIDYGCFVALANGTLALEAAMSMYEPTTVYMPSYTFIAVASAATRCGHKIEFVDICIDTWTINLVDVDIPDGCIVVAPTVFGIVPEIETDADIILDNAEGFGAFHGKYGIIDTYSFHATKIVTCGEGGGVVCDFDTATRMRKWRNFGFDGVTGNAELVGTNAKMSEFHAAIGALSLKTWQARAEERSRLLSVYKDILGNRVQFQAGSPYNCVILTENRDRVEAALTDAGVDTRRYFMPIHRLNPYKRPANLPITNHVADRVLAVPLWAGLGEGNVEMICDVIKGAL